MKDLKQILSHLPKERIDDLELIVQKIVDTHRVDIIVLFGSFARGDFKTERGAEQGKKSDFDILIVTEDGTKKKWVVGKLRGAFKDMEIVVQTLVVTIGVVNKALEENQYFYSDIKKEGIELYNSGSYDFAAFKGLTPTRRREIAEYDFKEWFGQANGFWEDFEHNQTKIDLDSLYLRKCSFHLQQCIEMCYTAIEMVFSHYNPHEHNLFVLRDRNVRFHKQLKGVFHYEDEAQAKLFDQLNYAYIGGRYRNETEFPVDMDKINFWKQETETFLKLTEEICTERIQEFKNLEKASHE
ncbi:MAG: putative nucleotidyltransferase/HEPN domain-containing protein [Crocinitomix sp.]|jgi:predicted nucleotidyltransferase/HEPN domain-containing protein